jgi:hypothetical protein
MTDDTPNYTCLSAAAAKVGLSLRPITPGVDAVISESRNNNGNVTSGTYDAADGRTYQFSVVELPNGLVSAQHGILGALNPEEVWQYQGHTYSRNPLLQGDGIKPAAQRLRSCIPPPVS